MSLLKPGGRPQKNDSNELTHRCMFLSLRFLGVPLDTHEVMVASVFALDPLDYPVRRERRCRKLGRQILDGLVMKAVDRDFVGP